MKTSMYCMLALAASALAIPFAANAQSSAMLVWQPVVDARLTGYVLYWGTNSGNYLWSAGCAGTQTNITVNNLVSGQTYYFAVKAASSNGLSAYSTEAAFTSTGAIASGPEIPLPPGGGANSPSENVNDNNGNGNNAPPPLLAGEIRITGIPQWLSLAPTNGDANLTIQGTVGATVMIQSTTNLADPDGWVTTTNLILTNAAALDSLSNPPTGVLADAFAPASQSYDVSPMDPSTPQFYRTAVVPDYAIVADSVLPSKGYGARLIVVNMPGFVDDVCYVSPTNSFIYYDGQTYGVGLVPAGSTIRAIASTYAGSLSLNWTSASEFLYSNGMAWVLATVVETEDPSTDPVAGEAGTNAPIVINF